MKKIFMYINVDWFFLSHRLPIAKEAIKHDIDMHVFTDFTRSHRGSNYGDFNLKKSKILRKNISLISLIKEFFATFFQVKKENPDLIHAVTIKPILFLGLISRMTRTPFVGAVSGLGPAFQADGLTNLIRRNIIVIFYRFIFGGKNSHLICQSIHDSDVLIKNNIVSNCKISLIHGSGVDLQKFKPLKKKSTEKTNVLMASRLLADKGVIEFCQAAKIIKKKLSRNIVFKLAGPIDNISPSSLLLEDVKKLCNESQVDYLGEIKCINNLLGKADLFVYPSYYPEGIPKVLLEASACGIPVVTTNHPGCRDAIIEGQTGVLVPVKDAVSLAEEIEYLLDNPDKMLKMGKLARLLAERCYSDKKVVAKHYEIYKALMNLTSLHKKDK
jgi:glycosyltransferase involved in cell wall biosynthesis